MGIDPDKVISPKFRAALEAAEVPILPALPPEVAPARPLRRVKLPESKIHDQITSFCDRNGIIPVHTDPTRKSTIRSGYPDFFCCCNGRVVGLEVKVPPNKLSQIQELEFANIERCGVFVHLCEETSDGAAYSQARQILTAFFDLKPK
jgi:hypothetical protein